jgi:hypothetical protein
MASSINALTTGSGGVVTTADNSGDLNIQSGGSTKIAVTSAGAAVTGTLSASGESTLTGNVGVGVTPSAWSTYKGIDISTYGGIGSDSATFILTANTYNNGTSWIAKTTGASSDYIQSAGAHTWRTAPSVTAGTATVPTTRMILDASGNLNVGTSGTGTNSFQQNTNTAIASLGVIAAQATTGNQYGISVGLNGDPNNTTNYFMANRGAGSTDRCIIRSNGGIANYSANNVNLSDRREKTNFAPAGNYLDKICAIPVQTFNYNDQNLEEDDGLTLGVVAQDVQAVCPEMVMESNWAGKDEPEKLRLSIYQTDLQYALMKSIQEQQALIENLTTRLTALENK